MNKMFRLAAFVAVVAFCATSTFGAGFGLYEFSARGNAMGGAVLAGDAEPASLALNPALITDLKGYQVQLGVTEITASARVTYNHEGQSPDRVWWTLPTFYYTQQVFEDWYFGLGAFPRFGLSGHYPDKQWVGSIKDLYDVNVESYSIQPTIAFQATERLSVAAAAEIMYFNFGEEKTLDLTGYGLGYNNLKVKGDSWGLGAMLALAYKANDQVNFGASFRTRVKQGLDGTSTFANPIAAAGLINGSAHGDLMLPAQLALGVSYRPIDDLFIEFNWTNIFWSSFSDITIAFEHKPGTGVSGTDVGEKNWKDAYRMGLGSEYRLSNVVKFRGSYIFDKTPTNGDYMDVLVPVSNRHLFGAGIGLNLGKDFILDASYTFLIGESMSGNNIQKGDQVRYGQAFSHMIGLSLRYTL